MFIWPALLGAALLAPFVLTLREAPKTRDQVDRISFKLHENGLTRDLVMDYGDFSMTGKLVNLSLFPVPQGSCKK